MHVICDMMKLMANIGILEDPKEIFSCIEYIYLSENRFTGHIPTCFGNMTNLIVLDLSNNNFTGNIYIHTYIFVFELHVRLYTQKSFLSKQIECTTCF
jgi:hypothetical protein